MKYKAFISYKHHVSTVFAERLEQALKTYAKPWLAPPFKVFRDEKHLRPGVDLPEMIRKALNESEFLILLASKEATESPWVADELLYWCKDLGRVDNLILVLVKDSIVVDATEKTIDWTRSEALPKVLQPFLNRVPLYVDLSQADAPALWNLGEPEYKKAINKIVARFRALDPNDMIGEEVLQHRKNIRLRNGALIVLVLLTLAATVFSIISYRLNQSLTIQVATTQSSALAARGQLLLTEVPELALLLVAEAWKVKPTHEARSALLKGVQTHPQLSKHLYWFRRSPNDLKFYPDGETLFVPVDHGEVQRISFKDGQVLSVYKSDGRSPVLGVALSSDGRLLAALTTTDALIWQTDKPGQRLGRLQVENASCLAMSPSGDQVVIGTGSGSLIVWDLTEEGKHRDIPQAHSGQITELTFSTSGERLYSAAMESGTPLKSWDTKSWQSDASFTGVEFAANGLALSHNGKLLAGAFDNNVIAIWAIETPTSPREKLTQAFSDSAYNVDFSSDDRFLASAHDDSGVVVWTVGDKNQTQRSVFGHRGGSVAIAFQPGSHSLASGGADGTVRRWDMDAPNPLLINTLRHDRNRIESVMFDGAAIVLTGSLGFANWSPGQGFSPITSFPQESQLLAAAPSGAVLFSESKQLILRRVRGDNRRVQLNSDRERIEASAVSFDGRYAATVERGKGFVDVWNTDNPGEPMYTLSVEDDDVSVLTFSPSENMLAAATSRGAIYVWSLTDGREITRKTQDILAHITALIFSHDSQSLYVGLLQGRVEKRLISALKDVVALQVVYKQAVNNFAIDRSGQILASSSDNRVVLSDANSLEPFGDLIRGNELLVRELVFSPEGTQLAIVLQDGAVEFWDVDVESWYRRAVSVANRPFTERETSQYGLQHIDPTGK